MNDQAQHKTHGAVGIPQRQLVGADEATVWQAMTKVMERDSGKSVDELVVVSRYYNPDSEELMIEWKVKD